MGQKAVRDRIIDICETLAGATVATAMPQDVQEFELPMLYVLRSAGTRERIDSNRYALTAEWQIVLLFAEINLGLNQDVQDRLFNFADGVYTAFGKAPRLELAGVPLAGVVNAVLSGDSGILAPNAFPSGNPFSNYWSWVFTLTVTLNESSLC